MPRGNKKKKNKPPNTKSSPLVDIPSAVLSGGPSLMVRRAVASGARHGIKLIPGRVNPALGDCSFEAPLFNVNDRNCFEDHFPMSVDYYRRIWCTDMENRLFQSNLNPGYSFDEWHMGWERVKESRIYEVDYFGDFILPAVACGLRKTILIFNTNVQQPRSPIDVINPTTYNVSPDSQVPVVLCYNLSHYESLHPSDDIDIKKSIDLVKMLEEGRYDKTYHDLSNLVCLEDIPTIIGDVNQKVNESEKNQYKIHVQLFLDNRETNITDLSKRKTANEKHD